MKDISKRNQIILIWIFKDLAQFSLKQMIGLTKNVDLKLYLLRWMMCQATHLTGQSHINNKWKKFIHKNKGDILIYIITIFNHLFNLYNIWKIKTKIFLNIFFLFIWIRFYFFIWICWICLFSWFSWFCWLNWLGFWPIIFPFLPDLIYQINSYILFKWREDSIWVVSWKYLSWKFTVFIPANHFIL